MTHYDPSCPDCRDPEDKRQSLEGPPAGLPAYMPVDGTGGGEADDSVISYTHWAYFDDESSARECAAQLGDYVTRVLPPIPGDDDHLLLAGRDVKISDLIARHAEIGAIVERFGGRYDGGESTFLETEDGLNPAPDPMLTGQPFEG